MWETTAPPGADRAVLLWLRACPALAGRTLRYGHLPAGEGLMLAPEPENGRTRRFIGGGLEAEAGFRLVLRTLSADDEERLAAEETLRAAAAWAEAQAGTLALGEGVRTRRVRARTGAVRAAGESGAQDHIVYLNLEYEVM